MIYKNESTFTLVVAPVTVKVSILGGQYIGRAFLL